MRLILIFLLLACPSSYAADKLSSLCDKNEIEVFNCKLKNKTLSLCGASNLKQVNEFKYRFGTSKKLELIYPNAQTRGQFWSSSTMYSGGGESRVHFKNGAIDYILFENTIRTGFGDGPNNPEFNAGIVTKENGKITSIRHCSNDAQILQSSLKHMPEEKFDYDATP